MHGDQFVTADEAKGEVFVEFSEQEVDGQTEMIVQFETGYCILRADCYQTVNLKGYRDEEYICQECGGEIYEKGHFLCLDCHRGKKNEARD